MQYSLDRIFNKSAALTESFQAMPCRFAFAEIEGDTIYPLHKLVQCREYLTDILTVSTGEYQGDTKYLTIYGFNTARFHPDSPERINVNWETPALLMADYHYLFNHLDTLHDVEDRLGIPRTVVEKLDEKYAAVLFNNFWVSSTVALAWYTQVLRYLCYESLEKHNETSLFRWKDKGFWLLPDVLKAVELPCRSFLQARKDIQGIHDCSGWVAFFTNNMVKNNFGPVYEKLKELEIKAPDVIPPSQQKSSIYDADEDDEYYDDDNACQCSDCVAARENW